ncbi:MAG: DinB family protein [Cytophagaceae bacterium]|nr:DinB family protein [Cytophagaceae bacterium]
MVHFDSQALLRQLEENVLILGKTVEQEFSALSDAYLLQPPTPAQWSIAQCLEHLNSYGHYYLPMLKKATERGETARMPAQNVFKSGWLGNYFAKSMQPKADGAIGLKMQAVKNHRPVMHLDAQAVLAEFLNQQRQLVDLLRRAQRVNIGQLRVPISIARWITLSVGDTFRFLIAHQQRHVLQAQRANAALASASPVERAVG